MANAALLCVAGLPLAMHLLLLAGLNLSRRPHVTTGARNATSLAFALAGFVIVGPVDMFLPADAVRIYSKMIWPMLICFYSLCLTLYLLMSRPKLVVYNVSREELRPVMDQVVARLDTDARWAGDSVQLPQLDMQLHLEEFRPLRNVSLVSTGDRQSFLGWRRLQHELSDALKQVEVRPNKYGFAFLAVGLVLLVCPLVLVVRDPQTVAQQLFDLLRLS